MRQRSEAKGQAQQKSRSENNKNKNSPPASDVNKLGGARGIQQGGGQRCGKPA